MNFLLKKSCEVKKHLMVSKPWSESLGDVCVGCFSGRSWKISSWGSTDRWSRIRTTSQGFVWSSARLVPQVYPSFGRKLPAGSHSWCYSPIPWLMAAMCHPNDYETDQKSQPFIMLGRSFCTSGSRALVCREWAGFHGCWTEQLSSMPQWLKQLKEVGRS